MRKFFLIYILLFGFLSAQDSTGFSNFFGITYAPFGQAQVRESPSFLGGYSNVPKIGVYKNEFTIFFTSTFGLKIRQKTFFIFDLDINKGSFLIENKSNRNVTINLGKIEESLTLITPKIGIKHFFLKRKLVAPYFRVAVFKTIGIASSSNETNADRRDEIELLEKLNEPFGIELGAGTEINLMEQLSFFLDAKFVYKRTSFIYQKRDYTFSEILKTVAFGFNMYF
jgi:hypothetical protein